MATDYTAWPTLSDVQDTLDSAGIVVRSALGIAYRQRVLTAVTQEITKRTHRQFIAAQAVRFFDGSGTGVQEVDECVSLNTVSIIGYVASVPLEITTVYLRQDNTYANSLIEIYQSSIPAIPLIYLDRFPQGRQNIQVDAVWGYGATIPADLWESVAQECAARLASESIFNPSGRRQKWEMEGVSSTYLLNLPGEAAGWHSRYEERVRSYTRPTDRNLRQYRPAMI